jgi:DNA replication protein DnaC
MLTPPTLDTLQTRRLHGMYHALVEQLQMPDLAALTCEERFGLLVDREFTERETRRLPTRLRQAKLRQTACLEAIDYRHPRGLDKAFMARLATCPWVREHHHVLSTGPTGMGKTWLGCALGQQACRDGLTALSLRLPRCLPELPMAQGEGRYGKLLTTLAKIDVLILDDWALAPRSDENRRDLLEIIEDRHDRRATIITSQLPVAHWHDALGDPTLADAILDRLVHNAYKIALPGESMRKQPPKLTRGVGSNSQETPSVAALRWKPASPGRGGNLPVVHVAGFTWTEWQPSSGLGGRHPWNMHSGTSNRLSHAYLRKTVSSKLTSVAVSFASLIPHATAWRRWPTRSVARV